MDIVKLIRSAQAKVNPPSCYRLARVLGVSEAAVSQWVNRKKVPSGTHLMQLIEIAAETPRKGGGARRLYIMLNRRIRKKTGWRPSRRQPDRRIMPSLSLG